jgi:hypothetical protein
MKLFLRRNAPLFYVLAAMLALYVPWLNRGYINLEYAFPMAAQGLSNLTESSLIDAYWSNQANPLGYSLFLAAIYKLVGYHDWFWLARLPSIIGCGLILVAGLIILRSKSSSQIQNFLLWSMLVVLNPMIIAYSTAATADILPVGLLMMSIALILGTAGSRILVQLFSAVLFGLSIVSKYNSIYFGLLFVLSFYFVALKTQDRISLLLKRICAFLVIPATILGTYLSWSYLRFDVFISNRLDQTRPDFVNIVGWVQTFGKYTAFLGLFCCLIPIVISIKQTKFSKITTKQLIFFLLFLGIGWYLSKPLSDGEMNFGGGFNFSPKFARALEIFGFINGVAIFQIVWRQMRSRNRLTQVLMAGLGPYLVLISASRPAQRYLIYAIPIVLLIMVEALDELPKKVKYLAVGSTALGFAAVSLLGMSYLTSQGNASEEMAVWVEENNLISQTSSGAISPHAGQHWWGVATDETRYEIIAVTPATEAQVQERVLHREPMKVLGKVTRVYLLRELPKAP